MGFQMKVDIPPLPFSTPKEYQMLNEFLARHPQPKSNDIANLCKQFLLFANGIDIFPKLPSVVRPGIKRWEINQASKLLGLETEEGFNKLFAELRTTVSLDPPLQSGGHASAMTAQVAVPNDSQSP